MGARSIPILIIAMLSAGIIACDARGPADSPDNARIPKEDKGRTAEPAREDLGGIHYKVNPSRSRLIAQVDVGGMLKGLGHAHLIAFRQFQGEVEAAPDLSGSATLRLRFKTGSVTETSKEFDEKDRQKVNAAVHDEALEAARFPEAVFTSRKVEVQPAGEHRYKATISGELALHGVTREVSFPATIRVEGKSLHAKGAFTILHSAFGIKRLSAAGGTIKAKDEIQVSFDIQADAE